MFDVNSQRQADGVVSAAWRLGGISRLRAASTALMTSVCLLPCLAGSASASITPELPALNPAVAVAGQIDDGVHAVAFAHLPLVVTAAVEADLRRGCLRLRVPASVLGVALASVSGGVGCR